MAAGDQVTIKLEFAGTSGYRYRGLQRMQIEGEALGAVEAARAVLHQAGLGTPENVELTVQTCSVGPASFSVYALGCPRSREKGVTVSAEEAQRFGVACLRRLGLTVLDLEAP